MPRQPQVIVYVHSNEEESRRLLAFLRDLGITFVEKDAWNNPQVRRELMVLDYDRTPVTLVDGAVVQGYQPAEIARLLGRHINPVNPPGERTGA